jgi:hypothetical protein
VEPVSMNVSQSIPRPPSSVPTTMKGFGPKRGRNRLVMPAAMKMATDTGRNDSPDSIGV